MVFRWLASYWANETRLVNKLANSYPIRRAAQLVIYLFIRKPGPAAEKFLKEGVFRSSLCRVKEQLKKRLEK